MKKLSAILLTLILVLALGTMAVSAEKADSPEVKGVVSSIEVKDKKGEKVSLEILPIDGKVTTNFQSALKDLKKEANDNTLKVVGQYDVKTIGNPEFPVTVTLGVLGISNNSKAYIMIEEGTVQPTAAALDSKVMALNAVNARALSAVQNLAVNTINTAGVKVLETTVVDGKVTFTLEKQVKKFSIVVDGTTAQNVEKENSITSPQTGSNTVAVAVTVIFALVAAAFAFKKVRA